MPNPFDAYAERAVRDDTLIRGMKAQLDLMTKTGAKLAEEYREKCAYNLMAAGVALIPSDHLQDHQFIVSRGVYEAAKRICENGGT